MQRIVISGWDVEITRPVWQSLLVPLPYYVGTAGGAPLNVIREYVESQHRSASKRFTLPLNGEALSPESLVELCKILEITSINL